MTSTIRRLAACMGAAVLLLSGGASQAQDLEKLRMTLPINSLTFYPIFVAADHGFFAEQNIDMEIVITQGDGPDIDALIAGSVEFAASPPHRLFALYEQGRGLLGIANIMNKIGINCFMSKATADRLAITAETPFSEKLKKLDGLTIGATRAGAFTFQLATYYVQQAGYTPQKEVKVIAAGTGPSMLAAIDQGRADIGCTSSPTPELAIHRGSAISWINNTAGEDETFEEFLMEVLYVRPDYAEKNPEIVRRVVKAIVDALDFIATGSVEEHLPILQNRFGGVPDEVLIGALENTRTAVEPSGRISQRSVDSHVAFLREQGLLTQDIPWTEVVTNDYLPN